MPAVRPHEAEEVHGARDTASIVPPQKDIVAVANAITPVMLKWLHEDSPGAELGGGFAAWVGDGWGFEDLKALQGVGVSGIVELYRQSPVWIVLAPMEAKFQQFVEAFVAWQPEDDDADGGLREAGEVDPFDQDAA